MRESGTLNGQPSVTSRQPLAPPQLSYRIQRHLKKVQSYPPSQTDAGLQRLIQECECIFEAEIEAGRGEDTGRFWEALYSRLLVSVCAKRNSLGGQIALHRMRTCDDGGPAERARSEEAYRALSRLRAEVEDKIETARKAAEQERLTDINAAPLTLSPAEKIGKRLEKLDQELRSIASTARGKRRYQLNEAQRDFPRFRLWNEISNSRISEKRLYEFWENPFHSFSKKDDRFVFVGELIGMPPATAYDYYKKRPGPKRKRSTNTK